MILLSEQYIHHGHHRWVSAISEIGTLAPLTWLGGYVVELYALKLYNTSDRKRVRYIPLDYSQLLREPDMQEKTAFQEIYGGVPDRATPVVMVKHASSHYYVVAFDYLHGRSVTYGRQINKRSLEHHGDKWEEWGGDTLWDLVASLHGWDNIQPPRIRQAVNWKQVSVAKFDIHLLVPPYFSEWPRLWCHCCPGVAIALPPGASTSQWTQSP